MDTMTKSGSKSLVSIPPLNRNNRDNIIALKNKRYKELDAEFNRQKRRLAKVVRQIKEGLDKKIN